MGLGDRRGEYAQAVSRSHQRARVGAAQEAEVDMPAIKEWEAGERRAVAGKPGEEEAIQEVLWVILKMA